MRQQHDVRVPQQALVDLGLLFVDIQPGGRDLSAFERGYECGFVHHCPSRRVDYDDAAFHFGEFGSGDYVAGVFLGRKKCVRTFFLSKSRVVGRESSPS